MNEDPEHPSPEAMPPEEDIPPLIEPRPFLSAAGGFGSAALLAIGIVIVSFAILPVGLVFMVGSGPIAGLILWGSYRSSRHYFARGALVFGIVSFLTVGVCFVGIFSSL